MRWDHDFVRYAHMAVDVAGAESVIAGGQSIDCDRGTSKWFIDFSNFSLGNCSEEWDWKIKVAAPDRILVCESANPFRNDN